MYGVQSTNQTSGINLQSATSLHHEDKKIIEDQVAQSILSREDNAQLWLHTTPSIYMIMKYNSWYRKLSYVSSLTSLAITSVID